MILSDVLSSCLVAYHQTRLLLLFPLRPPQMAMLRMYTKSGIDDQTMWGVLQNSNLLDTAFIIVPIKGWAQGPLGSASNSPIRYMLEIECLL